MKSTLLINGIAQTIIFGFSYFNLNAQINDSTHVEKLNDIEVIGIRVKDRSPFAIQNLNSTEIQKNNDGKNLPSILENAPSVLINSDDGTGVGYADIRVRGTDNQRINFTINGIPVNDAESQGSFFVNFPDLLSSAGSLQIQRGVGSSTNGGGAFGASINISNADPSEERKINIINSWGSFNTKRHTINLGTGRLDNGFSFDTRLSKISSDGYIDRAGADMKSLQFLTSWKNENTEVKFNLFTGVQKTGQAWNGVLESKLSNNRRYNELGIKEDGTYFENQTDNYQQDYYQLFLRHNLNTQWKMNIAAFLTRGKGYYSEYRIDEDFESYYLPNFEINGNTIEETSLTRQLWLDNYFYGTVFGLHHQTQSSNLHIGGAATQYIGDHYGIVNWAKVGFPNNHKWYDNLAKKSDFNIYSKWEQKLYTGLYSFLDLQYRYVDYNINGFRKNPEIIQSNTYHFLNPKLGFTYFSNIHKFYTSFAVANKEPNRDDFEAGVLNIPKPERLLDFELGYQIKQNKWSLESNIYYMDYKNQLIASGKINDVGAYTRQNVDKSYRAGIEWSLNAKLNSIISFTANGNHSQNKIKEFVEYIDDYDMNIQQEIKHNNTDIVLSPNHLMNGIITFHAINKNNHELDFELIARYVGRQYLDNTSNLNRSIKPYELFHIRAHYSFQNKLIKHGSISLQVNNILNKMYESKGYTFSYFSDGLQTYNYYFPQAGTNASITLNIGF